MCCDAVTHARLDLDLALEVLVLVASQPIPRSGKRARRLRTRAMRAQVTRIAAAADRLTAALTTPGRTRPMTSSPSTAPWPDKAERDGASAQSVGAKVHANPHAANTAERFAWHAGWYYAASLASKKTADERSAHREISDQYRAKAEALLAAADRAGGR